MMATIYLIMMKNREMILYGIFSWQISKENLILEKY